MKANEAMKILDDFRWKIFKSNPSQKEKEDISKAIAVLFAQIWLMEEKIRKYQNDKTEK